ncbi:MAG: hypothetical protein LBH42_03480 [Treponema sp.]|jgi:hypothetical protein|nr:hypothetical protein [Treponema sp.]
MAKKDKAVYAPGELNRVRDKLGVTDRDEAKLIAQKLGGEIGYERTVEEEQAKLGKSRQERVDVKIGGRPRRLVELPLEGEEEGYKKKKSSRKKGVDPADDPLVPLKANYWERIKMDRFAGSPEFEIKTTGQVFQSIISLFSDIPDFVNPVFVTRRMKEYYKKIEVLVVTTRNLFPRNNTKRNERMKKNAPLACAILDVIRHWDIEKISGDLAKIQSNPKNVKVSDFAEILKAVYRPLFILGLADFDAHIRGAYKILYKVLYIENAIEAQNKYQEPIRIALAAYSGVCRDVHYFLYPLLMKTVSARFLPYKSFFAERKNRIMSFLNVTEDNQIDPGTINIQEEGEEKEEETQAEASKEAEQENKEEVQEEELSEEERAVRSAEEAEKKALERGLKTLEMLFPKAGWDILASFPDLYPYFVDVLDLKKGIVNIAPSDPLLQIYILMRILEELFFGLRFVKFGNVAGPAGSMEKVDVILGEVVNDWRYFLETSFEKEYLPRMAEYGRILEGSSEERNSPYTKKLLAELHWIKRLYLLPFYKFESLVAPPFQKKDTTQIYAKIKTLRRYLTAVATGIEKGNKLGGADARTPCDGINNPWESYIFQVPNPLSTRLDALLNPKMKNNASLIYFCLAVATVLDYVVNSEDSWAYATRSGTLVRNTSSESILPFAGTHDKIDAEALFKQSLKDRQKNNVPQK